MHISPHAALSDTFYSREVKSSIEGLLRSGGKPQNYNQLWEKFKIKSTSNLQKEYVGQIENRLATNLLEAVGNELVRARLLCASSKYAHRWLTTLPTDKPTMLTNNQFSLALRNLLALPIRADLPVICPCKQQVDLRTDPHHPTACNAVRKRGATTRHNRVVQELTALARSASMGVIIEPRSDDAKVRQRLDIQLVGTRCFSGGCVHLPTLR